MLDDISDRRPRSVVALLGGQAKPRQRVWVTLGILSGWQRINDTGGWHIDSCCLAPFAADQRQP
jgi:hypothetical protein